jgi:hypothetical protein
MKAPMTDGSSSSDVDLLETISTAPLFPALANNQLQELRGVVQKPLIGRHVLIPLTSKAFVVGSLTPSKGDGGEEQVFVANNSNGNATKTVLRKDISEELEIEKQRRKDEMQKLKKSMKTIHLLEPKQTKSDIAEAIRNHQADDPIDNSEPELPFFEIKEEIDGTGKVIRSETVNVTKQLELIEAQFREETGDDSVDPSTNDGIGLDNNQMDISSRMDDATINTIPNDQEYQAITTRLDELARLEEETESKSAENRLSALKLQSNAWSKGFFSTKQARKPVAKKKMPTNGLESPIIKTSLVTRESQSQGSTSEPATPQSAPRPAKPQASKASKAKVDEKDEGWSKGFLNKSKKPAINTLKKATGTTTETADISISDESAKKVSFQTNVAEVREIPRIGNQSVSSLKKQPAQSSTVASAKPFDASVVSSVVRERPVSRVTDLPLQGRPQKTQEHGQPKKKLSKFAQERLQNR